MMMSDESQQTDLFPIELKSMSSQGDSHAKTSPLQEAKKEFMQSAVGCGQSAPVFLGTFDPDTPSLKTSQTCLLETGEIGLSEFYGTFPRSGTMRSGTVYQLPRLAPTITEIGSGLWLTPTSASSQSASMQASLKEYYRLKPRGQGHLAAQVAFHVLPTPTANEDAAGTPEGNMKSMLGNHPFVRGESSEQWLTGTLNPTWVEWLMGFPLGHTDLNA